MYQNYYKVAGRIYKSAATVSALPISDVTFCSNSNIHLSLISVMLESTRKHRAEYGSLRKINIFFVRMRLFDV